MEGTRSRVVVRIGSSLATTPSISFCRLDYPARSFAQTQNHQLCRFSSRTKIEKRQAIWFRGRRSPIISIQASDAVFLTQNFPIFPSLFQRIVLRKMSSQAKDTVAPDANRSSTSDAETTNEKKRTLPKSEIVADDQKASNASSSDKRDKRPTKVPKKDLKSSRHKRGFDEDRDDRNLPAHEGSYANAAQRELFGIGNLEEHRFQYPEEAKMVKRKVALLLGFIGSKYGGFQINVGQQTLQGEIELALYKAGLLSPMNFGSPHKYSWSNSARTDKGVHACAQVCSLKVETLESEVEDSFESVRARLQEYLPKDIEVLGIVRTTRNFCSRTQRDRVRYQYMIPSFLMHPNYRQLLIDHGIPLEGRDDVARAPLLPEEVETLQATLKDYRVSEEQRQTLKTALKKYVGTHPFHNFTKGLKVGQAQANRYIDGFVLQDPVIMRGMEWIPTQVLGDSFLLHQIRKMVSLAVDVTRGVASLKFMDKALSNTDVVCVSLAPPHGLFLETSFFGGYNRRKQKQTPDFPDIDFLAEGPTRDRWESFRSKIRQHIVEEELKGGTFVQYLYQQECLFEYQDLYKVDGEDPMAKSESKEGE